MKRKRSVFIGVFAFLLLFCGLTFAATRQLKLTVFYSPHCQKCLKMKKEAIPQLQKKFQNQLSIEYKNLDEPQNFGLLLGLQHKYDSQMEIVLPVFYSEGRFLYGNKADLNSLTEMVRASLGSDPPQDPDLPQADFVSRFKEFNPLLIAGAGLIDGINPCAFTVIVFFMSFLAVEGYKKKELIVIGLSFILAVLVVYILLGVGLFGFLYTLKGFWAVSRAVNYLIGIFSIFLGFCAVYDIGKFRKTGSTQDLILQLPRSIKNRIQAVIGSHYRKPRSPQGPGDRRGLVHLIISAFACGFLISLLEAVCTGQTYLPTIGYILKTSSLKLRALWYLVLYNLMFILPLLVIFLFAVFGTTSEKFSGFFKKRLIFVKILMAVLFFGLGGLLIWNG